MSPYQIWIEAEHWKDAKWDALDSNTDVIVTVPDKVRWGATFFAYLNVATLVKGYQLTGECLSDTYFWTEHMMLIGDTSRQSIEAVVASLTESGEFKRTFKRLGLG